MARMVIGTPAVFAIESGITEAYESLGSRALGYLVIHIGGHRYGVVEPEATLLACSYEEVGDRLRRRGRHTASFAAESLPEALADAVCGALYAEEAADQFFGVPLQEFHDTIYTNHLLWAPDGDEAFDDGSYVLHFDVNDRVRLIGYTMNQNYRHEPGTLRDVWLTSDEFYRTLREWHGAFEDEWKASPKVPA